MTINECCQQLKQHMISDLRLDFITLEEFSDDLAIFSPDGLGLDSLDAVELAVIIEKHFSVIIENNEDSRNYFKTPLSLAQLIMKTKQAWKLL